MNGFKLGSIVAIIFGILSIMISVEIAGKTSLNVNQFAIGIIFVVLAAVLYLLGKRK